MTNAACCDLPNCFEMASASSYPSGTICPMESARRRGSKGTFTFIYLAGDRVLQIIGNDGRWCVTVDGARLEGWFVSKADAWAAGLAQAGRLGQGVASSAVAREGRGPGA